MGFIRAPRRIAPPTVLRGVDRSHAVGRSVVSLWPFGANGLADLGRVGDLVLTTTGATRTVGFSGQQATTTNGHYLAGASSTRYNPGAGDFSLIVGLNIPSASGGVQVAVGNGEYWFGCESYYWTFGTLVYSTGSGASLGIVANSLGINRLAIYTRRSGVGYIYIDGQLVGSAAETTTYSAGSTFSLGRFGAIPGYDLPANYWFGAYLNTGLTAELARDISDDPWQLAQQYHAPKLIAASAATLTATLAATDGADTFAGTGTSSSVATLTATMAAIDGADIAAGTGTIDALYTAVNDSEDITGAAIMVLVPAAGSSNPYSAGTPTGVIIYTHGTGEDAEGLVTDALKADCVAALLDAGYILAGANDGGWGTDTSISVYAGLDKWVRENYNVSNVCIWSQSMGGISGLLSLARDRIKGVVGWLGTYPICSLAAANAGTNGSNFSTDIASAYGISGTGISTYANKCYGHDPALLSALAFRNVPMRFYASAADSVVGDVENSIAMAALVATSCRESAVVTCTGDHGNASHFVPAEYVAFFQRCFANPVAVTGAPFDQPIATKTATVTLVNESGTAQTGLTSLKWAFWDEATPDLLTHPTDQGAVETTDGSGVLTITVHTNLATSGIGWMVVTNSDGTVSATHRSFSGPVVVS